MYGCAAWTLTAANGEHLRFFERRKICGPIVDAATMRICTNKDLEDLYGDSNIVNFIYSYLKLQKTFDFLHSSGWSITTGGKFIKNQSFWVYPRNRV